MKRAIFGILVAAVCMAGTATSGDAVQPPAQVVRELIEAAKANDLERLARRLDCGKVAMGRHGRTLQDTVAFLRSIDLGTAEIVSTDAPTSEKAHVVLRTPDHEIRLDLDLYKSELVLGEAPYTHREVDTAPYYMVTEIHQHP